MKQPTAYDLAIPPRSLTKQESRTNVFFQEIGSYPIIRPHAKEESAYGFLDASLIMSRETGG